MLREYIISEVMYHLNIKTTRSLAVATTGENVMRETVLPGAILTRVAESHIRVGTFEYVAIKRDIQTLKKLLQYSIERHYPEIKDLDKQAPEFLKLVLEKQIDLITDWMRKDLGLVMDEAKRNGARLPVTALVDQFYADVQQMGGKRWDTSSLIKRLG